MDEELKEYLDDKFGKIFKILRVFGVVLGLILGCVLVIVF